ncbi:hypothetical protein J7T55_006779 [Diaporthe amygdali]|uniref:uncharacterized protein n=1 Tax=Phomopsis amygdali TaxID=1214568 RepID=UPI0022FE1865|nr:uncharacterized protein J7T55_006779 [Diaporthe amygdali]KAJ0125433.1 hypothetical protein J7T55_006779 [Diaporthe amygdali]
MNERSGAARERIAHLEASIGLGLGVLRDASRLADNHGLKPLLSMWTDEDDDEGVRGHSEVSTADSKLFKSFSELWSLDISRVRMQYAMGV